MLSLATAPTQENPPAIEDHLVQKRDEIAAKEREISDAEARHASLVAEDAKLVAAINENRRLAALPEPQATDFEEVDEWHAALRKWRAAGTELDQALPPIERDRARLVGKDIPAAAATIASLRREHAWLEFKLAKDEHILAQRHAEVMLVRVRRFQAALAALDPA